MKTLLIGTSNAGKVSEVKRFIGDLDVEWKMLGKVAPGFEVDETGETFEENAQKKAVETARHTGLATLSSDGGMVVPALGGWPGVRSHRLDDGQEKTDKEIIEIFQEKIAPIPTEQRHYRFVSVFAFALPGGQVTTARGEHQGMLAPEIHPVQHAHGLPYRRFWWIPQFTKYFLDLTDEEKDSINHNRIALEQLRPTIEEYLRTW